MKKAKDGKIFMKCEKKEQPYTLLVGIHICTTIVENSTEVSQKIKSYMRSKGNESSPLKRYLPFLLPCKTIPNYQEMDTTF
jgi:hypothetical protein